MIYVSDSKTLILPSEMNSRYGCTKIDKKKITQTLSFCF
uniref:Uncharacterized protein n=1 Tax=Rhizophora mucronata TaxID=61149 RepID=A0A2P2NN55_RHIMU